MNNEYNNHRLEIQKLLDKAILSYPFYAKSDDELISDAVDRGIKQLEFSIFKMGIQEKKSVPVHGDIFDKNFFSLYSVNDGIKKCFEIKLSSFIYPARWISNMGDKNSASLYSTYKNQRISSYNELYKLIEDLFDKNVLMTTRWQGYGKYGATKCINLLPLGNKNEWADIIRNEFARERIRLLQDLLLSPEKYLYFFPVNKIIAQNVVKEFEPQIRKDIQFLQNLSVM